MIDFNVPLVLGNELKYIKKVLRSKKLSGDGEFTKKCSKLLEKKLRCKKVLFTTSGTHALEMAAIIADIRPGDEVIMPSYTFPSTANAFVLRGAKIVFVDIRPDTMNVNEKLIEGAITSKTKVIVPVHYAGVACEMDKIMAIAKKYHLLVIEDAAQALLAYYKGAPLGTIGDIGCFSFHETKNYTCGEGGAIILNDPKLIERAEIIREKGTNRSKFFRGEIDKYTWVDVGSSYLLSELNAAYLYAQLQQVERIKKNRLKSWNIYYRNLQILEKNGFIELPFIPSKCQHNGHIFYLKAKDLRERDILINFLKKHGIHAIFHYIPLHSSIAGKKFCRFYDDDKYSTNASNRIIRLPLYYGLKKNDVQKIIKFVSIFYKYENNRKTK